MREKLRIAIKLTASAGVSFFIMALMLRLVSDNPSADLPRLLIALRKAALPFVALYLLCAIAQGLFRSFRYNVLIRCAEDGKSPGIFHTFLVTITRNMLIDLFPARIGELSYVAMMNRGYSVSGKTCVSSLCISFVFDLVALVVIIACILFYHLAGGSAQAWLIWAAIATTAIATAMLVIIFFFTRPAIAIGRKLFGKLSERKILAAIFAFCDEVADAIESSRSKTVLMKVLGLSALVRLTKYLGLYLMFKAIVIPSFTEYAGSSISGVVTALISAEGAASLPVPSFMSFGTYEAGGTLGLTLLGISSSKSLIIMTAIHIISQVIDYTLGGIAFITFLFVSHRKAPSPSSAGKRKLLLPVGAMTLLVSIAFFADHYRKIGKLGSLVPPPSGSSIEISEIDKRRLTEACGQIDGFIVWSSNRHGNHDILMMELPESSITRLTRNPRALLPRVDYFPRISPDGTKIVFSRSQVPWVSQRNYYPWDIYIMDLKTRKERRLAKDGNTPTWSKNGKAVYFQRNGNEFIKHDLQSGNETTIYKTGTGDLREKVMLETPSYSEKSNETAVTLRKGRRGTVLIDQSGKTQKIAGGCELSWAPDSSFLYYIDDGGKQKNAVYKVTANGENKKIWLDLEGEHSHEYFPKLSNNKAYMVLGASSGGHEHDSADYEIFLWKIGTSSKTAARITFHSGNDCWPDIYIR